MTLADTMSLPFDPAGHSFLVTGGAGFIGSYLVRRLAGAGARVRVLDNFSTGRLANLADIAGSVELIEGDIVDAAAVRRAVDGVAYVLHLAALVSVPESVEQPERNFEVNFRGTHQLLLAARDAQVRRLVFSSSCAVYGDQPAPHHEELASRALSPYAAAKHSGEQLCRAFAHVYGLPTVCLRYFNVFGPRQNPRGGYAAAIPQFITALLGGRRPTIYGDGGQSRDFVYVANVVDANLLACGAEAAIGGVFNVGAGGETSLLELLAILGELAGRMAEPVFAPARVGDIRRSYGDISRARERLGYRPRVGLAEGLRETFAWYREHGASFWG
jgi:UDP-N-acetylglucosamine/UDP-N-acetyl-alpha-D-glucosaminouronate 4-epimerase